jgi:hypothetical protein
LGKGEIIMGNRKTIGLALLVSGLILLIASAGADIVGLGASGNFGWKQITGTIAGIAVAVVGFVLYSKKAGA